MQFNLNINQKAIMELNQQLDIKLGLKHGAILDCFHKFKSSSKIKTRIFNDEEYYWVALSEFIKELPLLEIKNKDVVSRYLNDLVDAKVLKKIVARDDNSKTYFRHDVNFEGLFFSKEPSESEETSSLLNSSQAPDSIVGRLPTEKSDNPNTNYPTPSNKKDIGEIESFLEWEPNDVYSSAIARSCPDLTESDLIIELAKFKSHYQSNWPMNPDTKWLGWCQSANVDAKMRHQREIIQAKSNQYSDQRVEEFHAKKRQNIAKVGTESKFTKKEITRPYPMDYRSEEEFHKACEDLRHEGKIVEPYPISVTAESYWQSQKDSPPEGFDLDSMKQQIAQKLSTNY